MLVGCRRRGEQLRIDVYDTGIGIPHAKQRAVFKEFHRLDQGARVARGLGLGLSIVERIARVLDYEVVLKSTVGRGSRFSVEVPRVDAAAAASRAAHTAAHRCRPARRYGRAVHRQRAAILDGMETLLGGWGCRVLKAPDLAEALAAMDASAAASRTGCWSTTISTAATALAAIAELRRRFGADLPAILITADRSPHVREEARAAGVQVLNKPIKPAALRALMAQWRVQRVRGGVTACAT